MHCTFLNNVTENKGKGKQVKAARWIFVYLNLHSCHAQEVLLHIWNCFWSNLLTHKYCKITYIKRAQMHTVNTLCISKGEGKFRCQLTFPVVSMLFFHHERKRRRGVANWRTLSSTNERPGCGYAWANFVVFLSESSAFAFYWSVAKRFIFWIVK